MEVVQRTGGDSPFGRRDVEEWSRLDELTGMLEHARVQTDQWAGIDAQGGSHKYGKKVVDASKTGEKGQHLQRQQLEVFQSKVAGGALQMVKSQTSAAWSAHGSRTTGTSTTVSSRTRWSSRSQATADATLEQPAITDNFANLELQINPIDVSTLKMKASVGRSGAIGSRRPPSARSRRLSASKSGRADKETDESENNQEDSLEANKSRSLTFDELKNSLKLGELLGRRLSKSSSTDDLPIGDPGRDSDDSGSWRRGARVRRSLQFSTKEDGGTFAPVIATKRHSFVTVESLRDVRSRLKHFDPIDVDDYSGPKSIILKNDEQQINSSSGLVRAIEQSTKMASSTTNFGSASGKTDTDWHITPIEPQSLTDKNRTFVTLNENHSKDMLSPTKKRFNESFAFFRSSMVSESQSPTLRKTSSPARQNLITIPIIFQQDLSVKEAERKRFSLRGMIDAESSTQDSESLGWVSKRQLDGLAPLKRRSWAGDSTLFGNHREDDRTTSLTSTTVEMEETSHSFSNTQVKKNKRVEFCKTEVHFAAESGKFNIVETDEKPPPSNNFRRRRRSHPVTNTTTENPPQVAQKPPLPELRFGDTTYEKEMLTIGVETKTNHSEITEKLNVKIAAIENKSESEGKQIFATTINRPTDLEIRPRASSINETTVISKSSVALRFQPPTEISKSSPNSTLDSNAGPMELQKLIKSLRPTPVQRRSVDFTQSLHITEEEPLQFSVPERIRYLEDRKTKGFSTTVNVGGTTVVRNSESIWLQGSGEMENNAEVAKDEKKDVVETSSNRSPPQISPSKIVAPIAPANPRICNGNAAANSGSSITSISLSYQSSQPKILASINAPAKPLAKKEHEPTKIVAPIPVKCTRPIKYPSDNNKVETNKPTCPRLEKMSAFQASKVESKYSSLSKKEGSPVRLGDITAPRSLSPAKSKFSTRTSSPAMRKKKPEFYFGAEVLEVEPRPSDDRRRLDDSEEEDVERPVRKREPSPSKSVPSKTDFGQRRSSTKEKTSTTALIEELTRAADEILQAVNGYDDSAPSSDEDAPRPVTLLPALKEGEVNNEKISKVSSSTTTRTTCSRLRKSNIGRTSSNSSVESTSHEANTTPRSLRTRKTTTNGTRTSKLTELSTPTSRRQRVPRKRSDSLNSSKGDEEEAEIAKERLRMSKSRRSANSTSVQESSKVSKTSSESVVKSDLSKVRAPVERIIPPANRKGTVRGKKEDMFHSNRVINGATAERRLQLLESSCSGSGLRSDSSPGMKRYQHRTVRNAPLKVSAK
ncbi:uncharacterized protein LOC132201728 isoform X2 [Neocloeon triangulifer]|uniref:uncharacterized protein LOC132201728 isoform X2 n=1 Tax=Neocloeon triangulifer TaxID=2078957 RepID=UPI00286F31C1|nr:uncharacterized protein LOC132201728 isoform X2 [Neocloeon triangulifer]